MERKVLVKIFAEDNECNLIASKERMIFFQSSFEREREIHKLHCEIKAECERFRFTDYKIYKVMPSKSNA